MKRFLYVREYSDVEGIDFWKMYLLVGSNIHVEKSFWETYPEFPKLKRKDDKKIITIKDKEFFVKIYPHVEFLTYDTEFIPTVDFLVKKYVDMNINYKIFFTLKSYEEYLREKVYAFNEYNYKQYTYFPRTKEIRDFRLFPSHEIKFPQLRDDLRILDERAPPVRISDFDNMSDYEKKQIIKNWTGIKGHEPLESDKFKRRRAIPRFFNPTLVIVEFSGYIKNENKHLKYILSKLEKYKKDWNLYKRDVTFLTIHIKDLISRPDRKRSKLDILVNDMRLNEKILTPGLVRKIYGYSVLKKTLLLNDDYQSSNISSKNGLYIVRENGEFTNFVYVTNFEKVQIWTMSTTQTSHYFDLVKLLGSTKNLYYFTNRSDTQIRLKSRFLILTNEGNWTQHTNKIGMEFVNTTHPIKKEYRLISRIYLMRKRYYYSDYVIPDIRYKPRFMKEESRLLRATVRPYGEIIINIVTFV